MLPRLLLPAFACLLTACATTPPPADEGVPEENAFTRFVAQSVEDYRRHYQPEVLADLLPPLLIAGTIANTNTDRWVRDTWQDDVRSEDSDEIARVFLHAGDAAQNKVSAPLYTLSMVAGDYSGDEVHDAALATWGARSLRANILGGPQAFALTYALGSHRPTDGSSSWNPWNDNDGVSGHTFYGAVPFLTAGRMSDSDGWRYTFYTLSILPALSRINDNKHYTSQAVMGWSIAWLATRTVARDEDDGMTIGARLLPGGGYVLFSWRFR